MAMSAVKRESINDIWARAVSQLPDNQKQNIKLFSSSMSDKSDALSQLETETQGLLKKAVDSRWRTTLKSGKTVIFRDVFERVVRAIEIFRGVGDVALQYDPVHAALPWAGICLVLKMAINDIDQFALVAEGITRIAEIICRYKIVEELYLQNVSKAATELERALITLYAKALSYLSKANQYLDQNKTKRVIKSALLPDTHLSTSLNDLYKSEDDVVRCQHLLDRENTLQHNAELKHLLACIDAPLQRMNNDLRNIQDNLKQSRRRAILNWCSPAVYMQLHNEAIRDVLAGTGQWLLSDPTFKDWRDSSTSNILWLHGIPGSGKTKLVSIVIEDAQKSFEAGYGSPPAFFYCSRTVRGQNFHSDPETILASLARQLSCLKPGEPLLAPTVKLYDRAEDIGLDSSLLQMNESYELVMELIKQHKSTTIVIDALDECDPKDRRKLLGNLKQILEESPNLVKIFLSSRDDQEIASRFKDYPHIEIDHRRNGADIERFVKYEVEKHIQEKSLLRDSVAQADMKDFVVKRLIEGAEGMFLWASLQLGHLSKCRLDDDIKKELGQLTDNLQTLYEKIYEILSTQPGTSARKMFKDSLSWLLYAQRTLTTEEFFAAISFNHQTQPISKEVVLGICGNFVVFDSELDTFRFAHLSVREFLETLPEYSSPKTNALAAEVCLWTILSTYPDPTPTELLIRPNWEATKFDNFREYSDLFWPVHCKLALVEGRKDILENLLQPFLLGAGEATSSIAQWVNRLPSYLERDSLFDWDWLEYPEELDDIKLSEDVATAAGLFVSCAFDIGEVIKGLIKEEMRNLTWRNSQGRTPLQVAVRNGSRAALKCLLDLGGANITNLEAMIEDAARKSGNSDKVMALILDRLGQDVLITGKMIEAAAKNSHNGKEVMPLLLKRLKPAVSITEAMVEAAAQNSGCGKEVMALLLSRPGPVVPISSTVVETAAKNGGNGKEVIALLLDQRRDDIQITEKVIDAAAYNFRNGKDIVKLLLEECREDTLGTEAIVKAIATHFDQDVLACLLGRCPERIPITKELIQTVAWGWKSSRSEVMKLLINKCRADTLGVEATVAAIARYFGEDIMTYLLDRGEAGVSVTEMVVKEAGNNNGGGKDVITLLLSRCGVDTPNTGAIALAIVHHFDQDVMRCFLKKPEVELSVTKEIVRTAAWNRNEDNGKGIMKLLLDQYEVETLVTEEIAKTIANHFDLDVIKHLLERPGADVLVTSAVFDAAASNYKSGNEIIELLLERPGAEVFITESAVKAAARNSGKGKEVMKLLLSRCRVDLPTTESMALAIAKDFDHDVMSCLLARCGAYLSITESIVKEAVKPWYFGSKSKESGKEVIKLLLNKCTADMPITEATVLALIRQEDKGIIQCLLHQRWKVIPITKEVALAITRHFDRDQMKYLLDQRGEDFSTVISADVSDTLRVVKGAAGNSDSREVMKLLLNECRADTLVTEVIVEEIVRGFDQQVMECLLACPGAKVSVTEPIVEAAVENRSNGKEIIMLLLKERNVDVPLPEATARVIIRNFDQDVLKCLLACPGAKVSVTEPVVKAAVRNRSNGKEIITFLLKEHNVDVPLPEATARAIIRNFDQGVLKCLLDRYQVDVSTEIVEAARCNHNSGNKVLGLLFDRCREDMPITETIVLDIARHFNQNVIASLIHQRGDNMPITETILEVIARRFDRDIMECLLEKRKDEIAVTKTLVKAAASNLTAGKGVMELLLDQRGERITITDAVIKTAARNSGNGKEIIALLLTRRIASVSITESIVTAAAETRSGKEIMTLLLNQCKAEMPITERVLLEIVRNFDQDVMACLLKRRRVDVSISVVEAARSNYDNGNNVLEFLFKQCGTDMSNAKEIAVAVVQDFNPEVMACLLNRWGTEVLIPKEIVGVAVQEYKYHNENGKAVIKRLLIRLDKDAQVSEAILEATAHYFDQDLLECVLGQYPANVPVTEKVVQAIAWYHSGVNRKEMIKLLINRCRSEMLSVDAIVAIARHFDKDVMSFLLEKHGADIPTTEEVLVAIAEVSDQEIMERLLNLRKETFSVTKVLIKAAVRNYRCSKEITKLLFGQRGADIAFTEAVVEVTAGNWENSENVISLLLDHLGTDFRITEEMMRAAAGNEKGGDKMIAEFFEKIRVDAQITEEVLKEAAGNKTSGEKTIALLLTQQGVDAKITEMVLKTAAANEDRGYEILALLLKRKPADVQISEEVVKAAVGNEASGDKVLGLLLNQQGADVRITEEVLKVAAANEDKGDDIFGLLLGWGEVDVQVTNEVLKIAAGNEICGHNIIDSLIDWRGAHIQVTEEAVEVAAGNELCGHDIIESLLDWRGAEVQIKITEAVVKAAVRNWESGEKIIALLLDRRGANVQIADDVKAVVRRYFGNRKVISDLLDQQGKDV